MLNRIITTIHQKQTKTRDMEIQTEFLQHKITIEFLPHCSDMPYRVFISEDPIGFDGGDVNLYAYVGNVLKAEGKQLKEIINTYF